MFNIILRKNAAISQDGGVRNRNLLLTHFLVRLAWGILQIFDNKNAKFFLFSITHFDTTYIKKGAESRRFSCTYIKK